MLGAQIKAIGNAIGMSEDQVIQMVIGAQRKGGRKLGRDIGTDEAQAAVLKRLQKVKGVNEDMPGDIDQYRTVSNNQVQQGEEGNQDLLQNFGGRDGQGNIKDVEQQLKEMAGAEGKVDPNVIKRSRWDKAKGAFVTDEFYAADGVPIPADFQEAAKNKDFGIQVPNQFAPAQQVLQGELARLQEGIDQYGADAFPGAADVAGRIEDDLYGGRGAEQALARELVQQDQLRQNAAQVEANNWRAQAAANVIGQDFVAGGRGAITDQAMENIGNIAQLGPAKVGYDFQVSNNPVDRGTAMPNALPLNLPDQYNAPASDNRFVGPLQKQEQWLADHAPGYKQGNAFGDYPQVAIGQQLGAAQAAIEGINFNGQNINLGQGGIRNLDDLQAAVDQVAALGRQQGVKFYDLQDGKNVYVENPGISEVLRKGGMNDNQINDVARGLFAAEAARRNPANQVAKNFYQAGMGQPGRSVEFGGNHPALGGGMVQIAQLKGEKIKGKEVRGQLQALMGRVGNDTPLNAAELADARMPMIGGVAGQDIPRAGFVRAPVMGPGPTRAMSEDAVYERFGPVNGQIANAVIQRFEQAQGTNPDGFGQRVERQRNMDPGPGFDPGPDPWSQPVGTGNGITQEIQKRASNPQKALPYGVSTSGPSQGPARPINNGATQGPRSPGIRDKIMNSVKRAPNNFRSAPRYQRYGAVGGAAALGVAGLSSLIGGERDKREEEQYQ